MTALTDCPVKGNPLQRKLHDIGVSREDPNTKGTQTEDVKKLKLYFLVYHSIHSVLSFFLIWYLIILSIELDRLLKGYSSSMSDWYNNEIRDRRFKILVVSVYMIPMYSKVLIGWVWVYSKKRLLLIMFLVISVVENVIVVYGLYTISFKFGYHLCRIIIPMSPWIFSGLVSLWLTKKLIK